MTTELTSFTLRPRNIILQNFEAGALNAAERYFSRIALSAGDVVSRAGDQPGSLLFVEQGIVSIMDNDGRCQIEVGMIGREGLVHAHHILGQSLATHDALAGNAVLASLVPR